MDIKQLKFLDALAQEEHFGRAASRCHVSQPTLSLRIRQLEEELGVPLIYRGNRFESLTPEGQRVLAWARRLLANYDGLYQDVALLRGHLSGRLRLGAVPSALAFAARLTAPFLNDYGQVTAISKSMSADEIEQGLEGFSLDVGISYLSRSLSDTVCTLPLYQEGYVALLPQHEYFTDRESISWCEVATLPLCLLTKGMHNRQIIEDVFAEVGCHPDILFESNSILTLYTHVQNGHWATIAPNFHARLLGVPDGVRALPLTHPELLQPVGLIWRDMQPLSPLVEAFKQVAITHSANIEKLLAT
ncbi:MAG: LysR family transcriptional regulator [Gammaproteobacteria bacterium]|nr:LysR family transcriptional regulator [Gammaproteobacteria bacterium]